MSPQESSSQMPTELDTVWNSITPVLESLFKKRSRVSRTVFRSAQNAISTFCTDPAEDTRATNNQSLREEELYDRLVKHLEETIKLDWATDDVFKVDEDLLRTYDKQWMSFQYAATKTSDLFHSLDERLSARSDPPTRDLKFVFPKLLLLWQQGFCGKHQKLLSEALIRLIKGQRDHMDIPRPRLVTSHANEGPSCSDALFYRKAATTSPPSKTRTEQLPMIKSVVTSFTLLGSPGLVHNLGSFPFERTFKAGFESATRSYYIDQLQTLRSYPETSSVGRIHWVLNRLTLEKDLLPDYYYQTVFRQLLVEIDNAVSTEHFKSYFCKPPERRAQDENPLVQKAGQETQDEMVRLLTKGGTAINDVDEYGRTALHSAVLADNITLIDCLLHLGAQTDKKDRQGQTASHLAVVIKNRVALNSLFNRPHGFSVRNNQQETVRDLLYQIPAKELFTDWREAFKLTAELGKDSWLFDDSSPDDADTDIPQPTLIRYISGMYKPAMQIHSLQDMVGDDSEYQAQMGNDSSIKWLHFPANNMRWVELLMLRYSGHGRDGTKLKRSDILAKELWEKRLHTGAENLPHARYMEATCLPIVGSEEGKTKDSGSKEGYVFMMPYIHWEYADTFDALTQYAEKASQHPIFSTEYAETVSTPVTDLKGSISETYRKLIESYMIPKSVWFDHRFNRQLHIRRSLDQYQYHVLSDTKRRDRDQLVSRLFRKGVLVGRPIVMVVDQLWLWVLQDKTVFTSFTGSWSWGQLDPIWDRTDVLENVKSDRSPIGTAHHLAARIIYRCLTSCLDGVVENAQFLNHYESEIGRLTDKEASSWGLFHDAVSEINQSKITRFRKKLPNQVRDRESSRHNIKDDNKKPEVRGDPFSIAEDIICLEQIKDIQDELQILRAIFKDQETVISKFCKIRKVGRHGRKAKAAVDQYQCRVESMLDRIDPTYKALLQLLDLKTKFANVQQADETAQQSRTLAVFTVVTIIFLPLSFLSAFFAIQIDEFPWIDVADGRLSLAWVSKYLLSISLGFSTLVILFALKISVISDACTEVFEWIRKPKAPKAELGKYESATEAGSFTMEKLVFILKNGWQLVRPKKSTNDSDGEV